MQRGLLIVLLLACCAYVCYSCSCIQPIWKEKFCEATYALRGVVLGRQLIGDYVHYHVWTTRRYKGISSPFPIIRMITHRDPGVCGVPDLPFGTEYIMTGNYRHGLPELFDCINWYQPWSDVEPWVRWQLNNPNLCT